MRAKLLTAFLFIVAVTSAWAQPPQMLNYQAIVRNAQGQPVTTGTVNMRFSIRETSETGAVVFQETQLLTPNQFGLVTAKIGNGGGNLSSVNWASGAKFLEVEMDATGGTTFTSMGASQLLSVPYALYAATAPGTQGPIGPQGP